MQKGEWFRKNRKSLKKNATIFLLRVKNAHFVWSSSKGRRIICIALKATKMHNDYDAKKKKKVPTYYGY